MNKEQVAYIHYFFILFSVNKAASLQIKICVNPFREMIRIPNKNKNKINNKNNNKDQV